jgi:hypothetical protein
MSTTRPGRRTSAGRSLGALVVASLIAALIVAPSAAAAQPHWQLEARPAPTYLKPGMPEAQIRVSALNLGNTEATGPITISDELPAGLKATGISLREGRFTNPINLPNTCTLTPTPSCTWTHTPPFNNVGEKTREAIPPYQRLEVVITVSVEAGESAPKTGAVNTATVHGGNAKSASDSQPITVSEAPVPFGVEKYEVKPENEDGTPDVQAGSHPYQMTTILNFNQTFSGNFSKPRPLRPHPEVPDDVRNLKFDLPAGLVARATSVEPCSTAQFTEVTEAGQGNLNGCPANSAIGAASVTYFTEALSLHTELVPVFNLVPQPGEPARFGFEVSNVHAFLDTSVRTGENYDAEVTIRNASTAVEVLGSDVTIWGVPGDPSHDSARGWQCINADYYEEEAGTTIKPCLPLEEHNAPAFLTLPTTCSDEARARETTVSGESWPTTSKSEGLIKEAHLLSGEADRYVMPALSGCETLQFDPQFSLEPGHSGASAPTGLKTEVKFSQAGIEAGDGTAAADVQETRVTLPEGVLANPGAANGLAVCSVGEAGFSRSGSDTGEALERDVGEQQFSPAAVACTASSKIGTVNIQTPLLPNELKGYVYLGEQDTNPFASPLVLYLIAEDPVSGVRVKLAGEVKINQTTGQIESVFKNTPPLPFSVLNLELFEGQRASQTSPAKCASYATKAVLVPSSGEQAADESVPFNNTGCHSGALPFEPSFEAGSTSGEGGAYTNFTLTIGHPDGQQALQSVEMKLPPGLAAIIKSVPLCPEPKAEEGTCGEESKIGESTAVSGLGSDPVTLRGTAYLAGPYKGAPFSVVDVTPANAGPFHLGNVVVRSTINVNPSTAAATITSDPLPQFVKGVPSQIKALNVTVNRPGFEFNPTNCSAMHIEGKLAGYEGASSQVSSPFQVGDCAALPFAPDFTASTSAHTSKADGASLFVKITYPKGNYANVAKSVTELPYALPSRLTTIQKACPDTTFEANPALCDEGSVIGTGIAHTPVFANPLVGPAYLVSHGNRAFPDIEIVLQGEGVTLVLDGHTDIKNSITKTTFESVPDAPVEVFELNLPEGPHSALAANDNLCKPEKPGVVSEKVTEHSKGRTIHVTKKVHKMVPEELVIPTKLTAQNGRVLEQKTKIAVSGCGGVKASKTVKKPAKKARKASKKKK